MFYAHAMAVDSVDMVLVGTSNVSYSKYSVTNCKLCIIIYCIEITRFKRRTVISGAPDECMQFMNKVIHKICGNFLQT